MFGPDQSLDIHIPPTELLAVNHFVARLAKLTFGLRSVFPFTFTQNRRFTPRQSLLFHPHSLFSSSAPLRL